jgi:PPOX class probable F420-dependent enzyme
MTPSEALDFVSDNHRAVLVTRRWGGGLQTSPVLVGRDDEKVVISTLESAVKTRNLRRDPSATICVINDNFFGDWIRIDGAAEIVSLPEAMDGLVDYYRRISGEHPDWDDYRQAMTRDKRVLLRVSVDEVGPA